MEETETTNKVLETKIDGLKELTDTRFKNIESSLLRIETANIAYALKTEVEEVKKDFTATIKRMEEAQAKHNEDDKTSFGGLAKGQQEVRDTLLRWGAILAAALFVLSFLSPVILKYWFHIG